MSPSAIRLQAQQASESFVTSKVQFLADVNLWPGRQVLDPRGWLKNFLEPERPHALALLGAFMYLNNPMVDALFRSAVQRLSVEISQPTTSLAGAKLRWRAFLSSVRVTYVEGERPNVTDSGRIFARKARQELGIEESQIVDPAMALSELQRNPSHSVLLVDDFVGSGDQMVTTWGRPYTTSLGNVSTFAEAALNGANIIYAPLFATSRGIASLSMRCQGLRVSPAHVLDASYSLTDAESILWPTALKATAATMLYDASVRAGIVTNYKYGWQGFNDLALAIAFEHSVPDATMPIFFWDRDGWIPLIRRT